MDTRDRPALIGSIGAGILLFLLLWLWLDWSPILAWLVGWSIPTFAIYGIDKAQAKRDGWRVPESLLHALALGGGVIGAWAGRLVFRHKTQKPEFLVVLIAATILWAGLALWAVFVRS